jgi:NAD(P)-dependent dehydrogenase (short-subunit alcohol dehydrogenase family)
MMSFGSGFKVNSVVLKKGDKAHHTVQERNAVVVGGATQFGQDTAALMAQLGYHTLMDAPPAEGVTRDAPLPERLTVLPLDVTDDAAIKDFAARVWEETFGVDVVVLPAGMALDFATVAWGDPKAITTLVNRHLTGAMRVANALLPLMRHNGRVVLVNATSGQIPLSGNADPTTARRAIRRFASALEDELARLGRRVAVQILDPTSGISPMVDGVPHSGRTLRDPVARQVVLRELELILKGHPHALWLSRRDRAAAGLYQWTPQRLKPVVASLLGSARGAPARALKAARKATRKAKETVVGRIRRRRASSRPAAPRAELHLDPDDTPPGDPFSS